MRWVMACVVLAAGCGRLAFDERSDATSRDGTGIDTATATGPFGTPVAVVELNAGTLGIGDDDPTLTDDMLEIYFNSNRSGGAEILRSTRAQVTDSWSAPQPVTELNSAATENTPYVTGDGLTIYVTSTRIASPGDIFVSTRASRTDVWSTPVLVAELSAGDDDAGLHISPDGLTAYMNQDLGGGSPAAELFRATRATSAAPWSTPIQIAELSATGQDTDPYVTPDDRSIYWSSARGGDLAIWRATRPSAGQPFTQLEIPPELATNQEEEDPWVSPDGHTLYFARGISGTKSIFMATR